MNNYIITDNDWEYLIEWRPVIIDDIITNYSISNIGDVRNNITNVILKHSLGNNRYLKVDIFINKKAYTKNIHRLVAEAFIPNPEHKTQVNHKDGNKLNNNVENLEWVTPSENTQHAYDNGLAKKRYGESNPMNKYTENQIHIVCKLLVNKIPIKLISEITNVNFKYISCIKNGKDWIIISSKYNIDYHKKYKYEKVKYNKLKKILIKLNLFNKIDLSTLLDSKYIIHKKKLVKDLEDAGYEIFLESKLIYELHKDNLND